MAEKGKPRIGGIGKFATFGGGDTKTSKSEDSRTSAQQNEETEEIKDVQTSMIQDSNLSTSKDATTSQLQNLLASSPQDTVTSIGPLVYEQLSQSEQTSKRPDTQKKKGTRSPEKEEGRQTIYFSDPEQRRILQALKFLERRDISEIVSDALDLYVEHSPFKTVLPAVLAAQEGKFLGE